jgi:hypothetical protein
VSTKLKNFTSVVSRSQRATMSSPSRREAFRAASSASLQAEASRTALSYAFYLPKWPEPLP